MTTTYRVEILGLGFNKRQFLAIQERAIEVRFVLTEDENFARLFKTKDEAIQHALIFTKTCHFFRIEEIQPIQESLW